MSYIDTRSLIETRDELKQQVLDSFLENFPHYEEMTESFEDILFGEEEIESWKEDWQEELNQIYRIDEIENEIGSEFDYGDRKSTRLNSSHVKTSYAVFCLRKK